ncbi:serine hydrolase domain-containing protein [Paenibacillus humicola]|uniref:serine hydrolase domain-containing protein n=1 Tax=Paenibacillus humicola TaxID=3110540 RepID=UPI00237C26D7|nr:serine hydrolase [Paenibacillus humicola]
MQTDSRQTKPPAAERGAGQWDKPFIKANAEALKAWKIKDIVVLRGDELAIEWHESGLDKVAAVYSCTKSVLSALIGIAIEQGRIGGIRQPAGDFFGELKEDGDVRKREITIEHLLTMTPGFDWPDFDKPYWKMKRTPDWLRFVLERPMAHQPGTAFTYNSGGSHLLSAIITRATGMTAAEYAERELFGKLGFRAVRWNGQGGVSEGGTGMHMTSLDMARFGLLYLRGGRWNGEQIVPAGWVRESVAVRSKGLQHYDPPIFGGYGYHWWISPQEVNGCADCYFAKGYGGQYIFVLPALDLVAAVRKEPTGRNEAMLSKRMLFERIVPFLRKRGQIPN